MKISVVTPSLNQHKYLPQMLRSVLSQQGDFQLQHLVIDGGSTDGTIDVLQSTIDPRLQWTSQHDHGQSDAVNVGLSRATGDVIGWLNSDDLYLPGALHRVAQAFENPQIDWVVGRYQIIDEQSQPFRPSVVRYKDRSLDHYSYRKLLRENFIPQPAVFWRREFGRRIGELDKTLHYTMDYDLWLRMGKASKPKILSQVLSQFRIHASSKSGMLNQEQFDEGYRVACRYFGRDHSSKFAHRLNVKKIVWAYRLMRLIGK